ncbi:hypothetical protein MMC08_005965 [Hypocenomyce scalaris]|nr:hypothetical protein [Hypocenomyce scalaris]
MSTIRGPVSGLRSQVVVQGRAPRAVTTANTKTSVKTIAWHRRTTNSGVSSQLNTPPSTPPSSRSGSIAEIASPLTGLFDLPGFALDQLLWKLTSSIQHPQINTFDSPAVIQTQLLSRYTDSICPPRELCLFREWLDHVPAYRGTSLVMDDAMGCLTAAYLGRTLHRPDVVDGSREIYIRAIQRLRIAIEAEGYSSQTLCATLFLSQYEASPT